MKRSRQRSEAADLALVVHELLRRIRFEDVDAVCEYGISRTECHALEVIALRGPVSVNEVAAEIRLNKSTASRVAASLTQKALVRSRAASDDGRRLVLTVTAKGRSLWKTIVDSTAETYHEILDGCSAAERASVIRILKRMATA